MIVIIGFLYIALAVLTYGLVFGAFQYSFPEIAKEPDVYWSDVVIAFILAISAPAGGVVAGVMFNYDSKRKKFYGLKYK